MTKKKILYINSGFKKGYASILYPEFIESKFFDFQYLFIVKDGMSGTDYMPQSLTKKMNFHNLGMLDKKISKNKVGPGLGIKGMFSLFYKLSIYLLNSNYDLIVTSTENPLHTKISFLWAKILNKKIIIWTESWYDYPYTSFLAYLYKNFGTYILKNSDAILVHGKVQEKYCIDLGIKKSKIFTHNFCSADLSKEFNSPKLFFDRYGLKDKFVVLYFSQLFKRKGLMTLLKSFKAIESKYNSDLVLLVAGKGIDESFFKSEASKLRIKNIKFIGYIEEKEKASLLNSCNVFVLPSLIYNGQREGWGLVINEAASLSKPIITTDSVGSAYNLVENGNSGYIIKNGDYIALEKSIEKIMIDKKLRLKMGKNSRKLFESFNSIDKTIKGFYNSIDSVFGNTKD